jgi:hypothetical protein
MRNAYKYLTGESEGKRPFRGRMGWMDVRTDGMDGQQILDRLGNGLWIGLVWFGTGTNGILLRTR